MSSHPVPSAGTTPVPQIDDQGRTPDAAARGPALTRTQRTGLLKVGDVLVPGEGDLPSFSQAGCVDAIGRMLPHMNPSDRSGVLGLLTMFRFLPRRAIVALLWVTEQHRRLPHPLATAARLVNIGIKGIVMTLYYSDVGSGSIHRTIGWDAKVVERPAMGPSDPVSQGAPAPSAAGAGAGAVSPSVPASAEPSTSPAGASGRAAPSTVAATASFASIAAPSGVASCSASSSGAAGAIAAARSGALSLRRLSLAQRTELLGRLQDVILARREEIVDRIQRDTHKSRSDALVSEIFGVLDNLSWLRKHAPKHLRDRREHTPIALLGKKSLTWYEPLGTIVVIAPWNYPFYQAIVPIASAFTCGNTVVFKPSEWTPLEGVVEDLLDQAGFAPNWVRVVYGDGAVGAELVEQRPDKVFFTGSTRTGRKILAQAAPHLVPVELELGGKDAMIVFEDVHVARAAAGAAWGALTTTGQSCTSVERVYVQEPIYDRFRAALVEQARRVKQEVDRDGDADIGTMTTDFQVKIVARHVEDAKAKGARVLTGADWDGLSPAIPPIVLDGVRDDMLVVSDETFGPVIPLLPFRTEEEVIRRANDSEYGLTASVWSRDLARARRVARALAVGGVSINNVMATEANPALPFGGVKQSGFGRYKGAHGLHAFCNVKSVLVDKDSAKIEANWYPYTREKYRLFTNMMVHLFGRGRGALVRFALAGLRLERYSNRAAKEGRR